MISPDTSYLRVTTICNPLHKLVTNLSIMSTELFISIFCTLFDSRHLYKAMYQQIFKKKNKLQPFSQIFCGSIETSLFVGSDTDKGKTVYSWNSPNCAKVGPTLGFVVVHLYIDMILGHLKSSPSNDIHFKY